jgi:dTMP kinase
VNAGRLIVFEGLDGCGKTTQVAALAAALREAGRDVVETREPSDGPFGRRIREMARSGRTLPADEELRWFVEDRRQHVSEVIAPALASGRIVVCDRYVISSVAYQGARGLDSEAILAEGEAEFPVPDLVLLLELPPEQGLERARSRGAALESIFEDPARLEGVDEILRSLDRPYIERIDATPPPDRVHAAVVARVRRRLGLL